jgi:hypothetical protein
LRSLSSGRHLALATMMRSGVEVDAATAIGDLSFRKRS